MNKKELNLEEDAKLVEVFIDDSDLTGINAISVVENPAIQEDFIYLSEQKDTVNLAEVSAEKRILLGPALIPNKPIYRVKNGEPYYIYFSESTIRRAAEQYLIKGNQSQATLEHEVKISGLTVVESWLVEDELHDKSRKYGLNMPVGTWMISMKVTNDEIWDNWVKTKRVKGFSIEAYLAHKIDMARVEQLSEEEIEQFEALTTLYDIMEEIASAENVELETYSDYPKAATNNAKRAIKYKEENGSSCGTRVGWERASQLANREPLSRSTIARMASFKRHQQHKDGPLSECGAIMWLCWGGTQGIEWAIRKLKQIDKK